MTNKKLKVGFTCSSFDLLHPGHVVMLKDCKNVCDYLIVGLQIDPSIDYKTKATPIQSLKERAFMVRSVKHVDEVIKYKTEADLYEILKDLNPDIRILGANWKDKEYTGDDLGIPVHWHRRDHDWSTTELRNRVYRAEKDKHERLMGRL